MHENEELKKQLDYYENWEKDIEKKFQKIKAVLDDERKKNQKLIEQ